MVGATAHQLTTVAWGRPRVEEAPCLPHPDLVSRASMECAPVAYACLVMCDVELHLDLATVHAHGEREAGVAQDCMEGVS